MKLHADKPNLLSVTAHGTGWISVNGQRHTCSVILSGSGAVRVWEVSRLGDLTSAHFSEMLAAEVASPELIVLGTGQRHHFLLPSLLQPLMERRIGVESMDTAAACRTYNILAGEGRRVIAALLIEQ